MDETRHARSRSRRLNITIERAQPSDLEATVALLLAQLNEHEIVTPADALRDVVEQVLADSRHGFILLAKAETTAVGLAYAAAHLSAEHGGIVGWLEELYVLPDRRGRGVGSKLLRATLSLARQLRWRGLELEIIEGHERAAALYARHGFTALSRKRFARIFVRSTHGLAP